LARCHREQYVTASFFADCFDSLARATTGREDNGSGVFCLLLRETTGMARGTKITNVDADRVQFGCALRRLRRGSDKKSAQGKRKRFLI